MVAKNAKLWYYYYEVNVRHTAQAGKAGGRAAYYILPIRTTTLLFPRIPIPRSLTPIKKQGRGRPSYMKKRKRKKKKYPYYVPDTVFFCSWNQQQRKQRKNNTYIVEIKINILRTPKINTYHPSSLFIVTTHTYDQKHASSHRTPFCPLLLLLLYYYDTTPPTNQPIKKKKINMARETIL